MNRSTSRHSDPILAHHRAAATEILAATRRQPEAVRMQRLSSALRAVDPALPTTVAKVSDTLRARGMTTSAAVHEALARSLADASIRKIQKIGRAAQYGRPIAWSPNSGLGGVGLGDATADAVARSFQGLICSTPLSSAVSDLVGQTQGSDAHSATTTGFAAAQGVAQCSQLTPPPTTPTPDTTATSAPPASPLVTYGVSFAVLAGILAVGYLAIKKRPKATA
jgi:hypothetical protein